MNIEQIYKRIVEIGIKNDLRGEEEIQRILNDEKSKYNEFKAEEKEFYDKDRFFNPFADTRVLYGDLTTAVNKVIVGIDMEGPEILLTYILNKNFEKKIDLIISHHPEGYAYAKLYELGKIQADLFALYGGVSMSVAEQLTEKRISEVEQRILSANHNRAVDFARTLKIPFMCAHTAADNCVTNFLTKLFEKEKPYKIKDLIKLLNDIPEYKNSAKLNAPPKIILASENNRCGKIFVDMTGGTEGAKEIFEKFANSGISTIVGMHFSEDHIENAKKANLNLVVAGHISSDNLGMNILFDELEKDGNLEFVCVSGFERIRHIKM